MIRPKLTKIQSRGPLGKAIGQLNRAVSDRTNIRTGDGMGMSTGPMGQFVYNNSPILMMAKAKDTIPAATTDDDDNPVLGKGEAYALRVSINDDEDRVLKADEENSFEVYNLTKTAVGEGEIFFLAKILSLRLVVNVGGVIARAKVTTAIPTGNFSTLSNTGRAQIYHNNGDGGWVVSGDPVTVWNDHSLSESIAVNTTIKVAQIDGDWYLIAADCPL